MDHIARAHHARNLESSIHSFNIVTRTLTERLANVTWRSSTGTWMMMADDLTEAAMLAARIKTLTEVLEIPVND